MLTKTKTRFSPPQLTALGFVALIFTGAILLYLPVSTYPNHRLSFLDALFEATSAVCVTGLVVVDTGTTFTVFGKIVLMSMIQIGGLGIAVIGVLLAIFLGKKIGLKERLLIQQSLNQYTLSGIVQLVKSIFFITIVIEAAGAILLAVAWSGEMGWAQALFFGMFHSVSSFNNAGFDLMGNFQSLMGYVNNVPVNLTISSLYILGGIGFTVILEVMKEKNAKTWSLHTRLVLITTFALIVMGTLLIFFLEYDNPKTLGPLSMGEKWLASYFHGTVPRTAGFNTLDITQFREDSILLTIFLMFIGGSSASTAGGVKTTTLFVLLLLVWSFITEKDEVEIFRRRIPHDLIFRALSITVIATASIFSAVFLLEVTEKNIPLIRLVFEAVSAFGTVGLSLGTTPELSPVGKVIIMFLMFMGRLGPLTIAFALTRRQKRPVVRYPEEKILIG